MNREILFIQTLEQVRKTAGEQGNCISKEQVQEAFDVLELDEEKLSMVFDYLKQHKIGIDEPVNLDDYLSEEEVNETVINPPAELGRLTNAGGGEQSTKIENSAV